MEGLKEKFTERYKLKKFLVSIISRFLKIANGVVFIEMR